MNKPFLLIAGDQYYPSAGTGDWRGCFKTYKEAMSVYLEKYKNSDWYEIVDLRNWEEGES